MMSPADQIVQLEYVVREQMAEIDRLRGEVDKLVDWIAGDQDALSALRAIYADPRSSPTNKVKAASAAIGFERAKPPSATIVANFSLYDALERPKTIEHQASLASDHGGEAIEPDPAA
jgi:hypothetical protein